MITDRYAMVLKLAMILAGLTGFALGLALGIWRQTDWSMAFFRAGLLCAAFTYATRFLFMKLFHLHVDQLKYFKSKNKHADEKKK